MQFETLAEGFHFEGMSVDGDTLWFSDVFDGGVRRRTPDGEIRTWLPDRELIGGILLNHDGRVLCSGVGGIAWVDPQTGESGMLIEAIDGRPILGTNEMIPDGRGGLYFGTMDSPAQQRREAMEPGGLYRLDVSGTVSLVHHGIPFPNGIGLAADGGTLYNNSTGIGTFAYALGPDDAAHTVTLLLEKQDCDGLALSADGGIWVTGYDTPELILLAPDGTIRERLSTPHGVSNVRFGGSDNRDIYITATSPEVMAAYQAGEVATSRTSRIMRARCDFPGQPIPRTRFAIA